MVSSSPDLLPVMLVEDHVLVRMMVHEVLSEAGFRVIEAVNGEEALRVLKARVGVMAVVSDIELGSGINGLELAHRIAQDSPGLGVVLTSGRTIPLADELPAGTVFLLKPYSNELLVDHVRSMIQRRQAFLLKGDQEPEASNIVPLRANDPSR